jgi:hypothetical protein
MTKYMEQSVKLTRQTEADLLSTYSTQKNDTPPQ